MKGVLQETGNNRRGRNTTGSDLNFVMILGSPEAFICCSQLFIHTAIMCENPNPNPDHGILLTPDHQSNITITVHPGQ